MMNNCDYIYSVIDRFMMRNLYIHIYSKPVVIWVKFNEESFKKGLETLRSFFILFKHNEIFYNMKISQNLNIRIYLRQVALGVKFNEESIENGLKTVRC